jgi:3-oxoacyl-[acyl-carrier protein] reductase
MQTGLKDRIAIVCGASSGMGRATAAAFAAEGAKVAMCARTEKTLFAAADEIRVRYKIDVFAQAVDVTDSDAVKKFVAAVAERFGGVDICVANAGGPPAKNFLSITTEEWNKAVATNFLSVVHLAREVIPHMQRKRWGRLITITSTSVRQPVPDLVLSNSVRPAVVGLVKSLAGEFGKDGILVNNVAPGYTETERLSELSKVRALAAGVSEEEITNRWTADIPLRRLGKPEEIADAILWLASEQASYITGQTILVDGGIYKGM